MDKKTVATDRERNDETITGAYVEGDDVFDLSTLQRDAHGGVRYVDPVLASIAKSRQEVESIMAAAKRHLRALDIRETKRLKALNALGSLSQYPTEQQRRYLDLLVQAVGLGNAAMIEMTYGVCRESECEKTNWRSPQGELLVTYYARVMTELQEKAENQSS